MDFSANYALVSAEFLHFKYWPHRIPMVQTNHGPEGDDGAAKLVHCIEHREELRAKDNFIEMSTIIDLLKELVPYEPESPKPAFTDGLE